MDLPPIQFSHEIPLFPLPNCVLFPGVVQPLHIFEPRYRHMMAQVAGDSGQMAIAMALLKPGWEKSYHGSPAIHPMVCVGRVIAHERLVDGKYNVLLQGVTRAHVQAERPHAGEWGMYRMVQLDPLPDPVGDSSAPHLALQRQVLQQLFNKTALRTLTVTPSLLPLFNEEIPLTYLLDALAFTMIQDVEAKQLLLETLDPAARGELLLRELVALAGRLDQSAPPVTEPPPTWPPSIGMN